MRILLVWLILVSSASAQVIDIPINIRQRNWTGPNGEGSCVHATTIMLLRYQRRYALADYWKSHYNSGETFSGLAEKLDANGVRWAGTYQQKNVSFLEWAIRTRRGAMVTTMQGQHMILLVHLDSKVAGLIDNNNPNKIIWKKREVFLADWYASNSWGLTIVGSPPPPPLRK